MDFVSNPGVGMAGLTRGNALQRMGGLWDVGLSAGASPAPGRETATPASLLAQESAPEGWESLRKAAEKGRNGLTEHLPGAAGYEGLFPSALRVYLVSQGSWVGAQGSRSKGVPRQGCLTP